MSDNATGDPASQPIRTGPPDGARLRGTELPSMQREPAGPRSRALLERLLAVESRNITCADPPPIFWAEARGAAVRDVDGNTYVDLTAGFGVANAGHAAPAVVAAIRAQTDLLCHGLGDVYPPDIKVALLERLAAIAPGDLAVSILGSSGADAVEAALKTALLRTGRSGVIAFTGGYHGLTLGALAVTSRADFRDPFTARLPQGVSFAPWPHASAADALNAVDDLMRAAERGPHPVGAIIVEPILGRGGLHVPPPGFLQGLRDVCDGNRTLLIFDEVYTGCGRTGRWFACDHEGVVPDILTAGKALTGSIPLSAAIGTPDAMGGWPPSRGEAIHTSTFLGNPVACAAALAQLAVVEEQGLLERASTLGDRIQRRAERWTELPGVGPVRGRGLLQGVPVEGPGRALAVATRCLHDGVLILAEGGAADVLAITPPAAISDLQLERALDVVEAGLRDLATAG